MSSAHKITLQQANEAVTRGDHEGFLSFCTENTKWTFVGERTLEGKAAVRQYMAETYKEPPRFHVERMIAEGDFLSATGKIALKDDTGKTTQYAYCDVWRFEDGKLAELHAYVVEIGPGG
jgi:ketosteroid isomerase-like protein